MDFGGVCPASNFQVLQFSGFIFQKPAERPAMQTQAQVSFDDIPIDEAVRDAALEQIEHLETFYDRITGCHVVIAHPHRHRREGWQAVFVEVVHPHHHAMPSRGEQPRGKGLSGEAF